MVWTKIKKRFQRKKTEIHPDEIFLDSSNLPDFDIHQLEGRIEKPISKQTHIILGIFFLLISAVFLGRASFLQLVEGESFRERSENNRLRHTFIFAERGVIYDRNDKLLAWNVNHPSGEPFSVREYSDLDGLSLLLGYVKYPLKDAAGFYYNEFYDGKDGIEKFYNGRLSGINGLKIVETNAIGEVESENTIEPPGSGSSIHLSIDSELQNNFFNIIKKVAGEVSFEGGAAAIMDINTGELIVLTSYPEYDSQILSDGKNTELIQSFIDDRGNPFLSRMVNGLYTPGSIVKPFIALAALQEGVIDPKKKILSSGAISLPNIYDPTKSTIFRDWKAHGYVDMREALSVSSDIYFYEIGGGYENQKGLGISRIEKYMKFFSFGSEIPHPFLTGKKGIIPSPEWKKNNFDGEEWTVGNTYHTSIGQYGFQVTPLQVLIATGALANDGKLITPTLIRGESFPETVREIPISKEYFDIIREGMRLGVVKGTASALAINGIEIAAKTGTAELGVSKQFVNSWVTGFFPYDSPKYAFVVIMEKGPRSNTIGATAVARQFFEWLSVHRPEYLGQVEF